MAIDQGETPGDPARSAHRPASRCRTYDHGRKKRNEANSRRFWTIAIGPTEALRSAATAMTVDNAPGTEASTASSRLQPATRTSQRAEPLGWP